MRTASVPTHLAASPYRVGDGVRREMRNGRAVLDQVRLCSGARDASGQRLARPACSRLPGPLSRVATLP
jgi:hypothetical protein